MKRRESRLAQLKIFSIALLEHTEKSSPGLVRDLMCYGRAVKIRNDLSMLLASSGPSFE